MTKPINPNITIPANFAQNGQKTDFAEEKILNGFNPLEPDILSGDNLNKFIDDTYKGLNYSMDGVSDLYKGAVLYNSDEEYSRNSIVFHVDTNSKTHLFRSITDNNLGNSLSNAIYWEEIMIDTSNLVSKSGDTMTGILKVQTPQASSDTNEAATTEWVNDKEYTTLTTYENGLSGYVIFTNGFCIQWGAVHGTTSVQGDKTITFAKTFNNTNFNFIFSYTNNNGSLSMNDCGYEVHTSRTTNSVVLHSTTNVHGYSWRACGFLASGQY